MTGRAELSVFLAHHASLVHEIEEAIVLYAKNAPQCADLFNKLCALALAQDKALIATKAAVSFSCAFECCEGRLWVTWTCEHHKMDETLIAVDAIFASLSPQGLPAPSVPAWLKREEIK